MGCGASKESAVSQTTGPVAATAKAQKKVPAYIPEKEILPGIKGKETSAAVAFEIPLDELVSTSSKTLKASSLPKLNMSEKDLKAKLASAEDRWKELDAQHSRKRGAKPQLSTANRDDPALLKKKLAEKEAQAALNRQKVKEEQTARKLAQQEKAKKVLERKKLQADASPEDAGDDKVSWGGEKESEATSSSRPSSQESGEESAESRESLTSSQEEKASRVSSGKASTSTDTTDVVESESAEEASVEEEEEDSPVVVKKKLNQARASNRGAAMRA